jgi:hypothetical protein
MPKAKSIECILQLSILNDGNIAVPDGKCYFVSPNVMKSQKTWLVGWLTNVVNGLQTKSRENKTITSFRFPILSLFQTTRVYPAQHSSLQTYQILQAISEDPSASST